MKRYIAILLLIIPMLASGQSWSVKNGKYRVKYGSFSKATWVTDPEPSDFEIYKVVDFSTSSIINDVNTEANMESLLNTSLTYTNSYSWGDSVVIFQGDTVQKFTQYTQDVSNLGTQFIGDLNLNGVDDSGDTVTALNFQFNIWLASNIIGEHFSKAGGIGGRHSGALGGNNPPSGGIFGPTCTGETNYYEAEKGWSLRPTLTPTSGFGELAGYIYHHTMPFKSCSQQTYGDFVENETVLATETWHKVNYRVILNSVPSEGNGSADGIAEIYVNDTLVSQMTNVTYRNYSSIVIDYLFGAYLTRAHATLEIQSFAYKDDYVYWHDNDREARTIGDVIQSPDY